MTGYQVVWKGPLRRSSGLGIASRSYVRALRQQGVTVRTKAPSRRPAKRGFKQVLLYHHLPHSIRFGQERSKYDRIILNTVWETSRIPRQWLPYVNRFDAVCVPSIHNKLALRRSGVTSPIYLVPHGVNPRHFNSGNRQPAPIVPRRLTDRRFIFLSVFGFQHRKNPEGLLRAYWEQFSASDRVALIIKTNGYAAYENATWIRKQIARYKRRLGIRKRTAPVIVIAGHVKPAQLQALYDICHAFVLPTRGEGVGLPFLEAMASGKPVIATGWGGQMDFLTNRNSFLIRYRLRRPTISMHSKHAIARQFRHLFAAQDQLWAEPSITDLKRIMKFACEHPALCKQKGRQGRQDALKLTWRRAGIALKRAVQSTLRQRQNAKHRK